MEDIFGISGVIFDLDGVIVSTDKYHYRAWKKLADEESVYFDEMINNRLRGVSRMESLEIILQQCKRDISPEEKSEMAERKNAYYKSFLLELSYKDLKEDIKRTLEQLKSSGLKLAIGSSSKNAAFILDRIGLGTFFDAVADGNAIERSKPDPQVFFIAADRLQLNPANCIVVEDAESGIAAAKAGGFPSIYYGASENNKFADYHIKRFDDLLKICI